MARRIKKKIKAIKNYDKVIKDICPKNIPSEWTFDMTSTLPKLLSAYLEKYIICAEKIVVLEDEVKQNILDLIDELKVLEDSEWCDNSEKIFAKLGKILSHLWW